MSNQMKEPGLEGGCLCGAIRYRITGHTYSCSLCFCNSCRRASGASPVAWLTVNAGQLELIAGKPKTYPPSVSVTRMFCGDCGTALCYAHDSHPGSIDVTAASLDNPNAIVPTEEIWLSHKVRWTCSNPDLAHFAEDHLDGGRSLP